MYIYIYIYIYIYRVNPTVWYSDQSTIKLRTVIVLFISRENLLRVLPVDSYLAVCRVL